MHSWSSVDVPQLPGSGFPIEVFDTRLQRNVVPVEPGNLARLYVCGITPYDSTHMGHAATYVAFDLLHRAWLDSGSPVTYVQNVTDVDDPLLERAEKLQEHWTEIAHREMDRFRDDMTSLRVLPPQHYISVSEHMQGIIEWISALSQAGATYFVDTDLYFDVTFTASSALITSLTEAEKSEIFAQRGGDPERSGKRNPLDALLWRGHRVGEPSWPSPFGDGRPGWHVECVAIALDHLGGSLSVQGGGKDLVFPHHEMCSIQAVATHKVSEFATSFVHAGMVSLGGEKMSKSLGNLVFISDLRAAGHRPAVIRTAIMSNRYCSDWEWTDDLLTAAAQRVETWEQALSLQAGAAALPVLEQVRKALAHDLDAPAALAAIDEWAIASLDGVADDLTAPGLIARMMDSLLGIAL